MKEEEMKLHTPDEKNGGGDYEFINEEVTPVNKHIKRYRKLRVVGAVILVAVLFGVIARASYAVSDYVIKELMSDGGRENVDLNASPTVPVSIGGNNKYPEVDWDDGAMEHYEQMMQGVQEVAKALGTCLVDVSVIREEKDPVFSGVNEVERLGNGIIIADNSIEYLILVNYTELFADGYHRIRVTFDNGTKETASVINVNKELDLAILAVSYEELTKEQKEGISVIRIGDSSKLTFGSAVLALGWPNGIGRSLDMGFVTALNETHFITDTSVDVMKTSMVYHEGAEGILVNTKGELVGVISNRFTGEQSSLCALSINEISTILQYMVNDIEIVSFGAVFYDLTDEMQEVLDVNCGISVISVVEDSVAYEAGFRKGDIITQVGDEKIYYASQFFTLLNQHKDGAEMKVTYVRNGREYTTEIEAVRVEAQSSEE